MDVIRRFKELNAMFGTRPSNAQRTKAEEKYLYLTELGWADAWIKGGVIPISLASSYKSDFRSGTLTPDETLIHKSEMDLTKLRPFFHFENVKDLSITNCSINGVRVPDIRNAHFFEEDGGILSFSNSYSPELARDLGKKACVKIINVKKLLRVINKQLRCRGVMKACEYTRDHQRNHFLKSTDDAWQDEFRMYWPMKQSAKVEIPPGTAEFVASFEW